MSLLDRLLNVVRGGTNPRQGATTHPETDATGATVPPPAHPRTPVVPTPASPTPDAGQRDELLAELASAEAPADLVGLVAGQRQWLAVVLPRTVRGVEYTEYRRAEERLTERLKGVDDDRLRAAATVALARLRNEPYFRYDNLAADAFSRLARRKMAWTPAQVGWLLRCATHLPDAPRCTGWDLATTLAQLGVTAAERLTADEQDTLSAELRALASDLTTSKAAGAKMASRVDALLRQGVDEPTTLPDTVLPLDDRFGRLARTVLAEQHSPELVAATLAHLGTYSGSVTPTKGWRAKTGQLLTAQPGGAEVAATLLRALLTHRDYLEGRVYGNQTYQEQFFVDQGTAPLLRAAVWAVALAPDRASSLVLLGDVAVHCGIGFGGSGASSRLSPVTTSAVAALAEMSEASPPAAAAAASAAGVVAQLARVQTKVSNKPIRKAVVAALERAAMAAGVTPGQLLELAVPDFGLGSDGTAEVAAGAHTALLELEGSATAAKLVVRWRTPGGKVVVGVPAQVKAEHAEQLVELRARAKAVKTAVSVQRARVEDLLSTGRTWSGQDWHARYAAHPIVGLSARSLLWQTREPGRDQVDGTTASERPWFSGLPERDGNRWLLRRHDGVVTAVADGSEVRLWHPLQEPLAEVRAWRAHLSDRGFRQPFKQAFREIYLLTPAEVGTGTYSNRFAGHLLRYPQAGALMRTRGWDGAHLGYWDGGQDGQATKQFEGGWRTSFYYETVENDADNYDQVSLCSTDQVRFERHDGPREGGGWNSRPLTEVPPLVLSEAMRDVDLFVGVTSVAADPEWADRGAERFRAYWQRESFGDLGESAQMRRQALERLLPRTKLADRAELSDRFLIVHGHLRDYKIHLGSGNILMSPADTYLCIVAARSDAETKKVYLPFEEDGGKLAIILSKAFLLAEDTSIDDASITRQLRLGL